MSKELIGSNGNIVGSERYFERLNKEHFVGNLMRDPQNTEYYDCLRDTASRIRDTVQEIFEDLRKHIGMIRYIPKEDRENLIKVLLGLYDICKITSASSGRYDGCVSILSLSDSDTRPKSRADDREIEDAAKMVQDSSLLTRSDRMDTIREAMEWGERSVSGNVEKTLFLRAVAQGRDREFLGDVWLKLLYADDPRQFTGRCGRVICTQEYIDHVEQHIFGADIPNYYGGQNGDRAYGRLITSSLENIAREIERDLEQGVRDNDYLQDENAGRLKTALKDLERCGVRCYSLERKIDGLAWFVGGDADKIRQLQQKLNELGIGERLKEDGVFGEKTKRAVDDAIEKVSDFLANPNKMRLLDQTVDVIASGLDITSGSQSQIRKMHDALEKSRRELQCMIWKLGAEYYLRPRGYDVAALLLEHSIESSPSNLYFSQSHWVTQKIMNSKGFKTAYRELEQNIQKNPDVYAVSDSIQMDFGGTGDTDLYYGIGKCEIKYTCTRCSSSVRVRFTIEDKYNFDYIRSISGDIETGIKLHFDDFGNLANDAGLLSQADGVISIFYTYIDFEKTVEMRGIYI